MSASAASPSLASDSHPPPASPTGRSGRLRRLSQLRAYTQNHLIPSSLSTSPTASSSAGNSRGYRQSLTRAVGLASSSPSTAEPTTARSPTAPDLEAPSTDSSSSTSDLRFQTTSSTSSRSTPAVEDRHSESEVAAQNMSPSTSTHGHENTTAPDGNSGTPKPKMKTTIRFFPYQDPHHSSRPSLPFAPMARTLPSDDSIIRVGRYSERDGVPICNPTEPSDAPIGFKSKVVSRKHCEFSFVNGQWHIKDVGSSSGTFLNRMRLSQPNMVSRLYAVRDGDILQLGIDFRGGEEMIFRCVRVRIECNRTWQQRPNEFNKNTESLIKSLGKGEAADDTAGCRECSICLGSVLRPYQCLFMAACAHVWHYKCIRRLIHTPEYPMFQCPNCRAWTDLSAEVDDTPEHEDDVKAAEATAGLSLEDETESSAGPHSISDIGETRDEAAQLTESNGATRANVSDDVDLANIAENLRLEDRGTPTQDAENPDSAEGSQDEPSPHGRSTNIPIPARVSSAGASPRNDQAHRRSETPGHAENFEDNPMTPRNDTGPLAFDGRAGRL